MGKTCEGVIKVALLKLIKSLKICMKNSSDCLFFSGIMRPGLNAILGPTGSGKSS